MLSFYQIVKELWIISYTQFRGFYTNDVYYTDTDSLYVESKHWDKLKEKNLIGKNRGQGKNDYKDGDIWYGLFLAPK